MDKPYIPRNQLKKLIARHTEDYVRYSIKIKVCYSQ